MAIGIQNITNVTLDNLTKIANVSSIPEFATNVNHDIYGGWLYFVLMSLLWVILFVAANKVNDNLLNNAMYSGAVVSVICFILRAIEISKNGIVRGLLSDHQMWIFPLLTATLAAIIWAMRRE